MAKTSIQWTDRSINPIRFGSGHYCQKISPGCAHCYASRLQPRFLNPEFGGTGQPAPHRTDEQRVGALWLDENKLTEVLRRRAPAKWFWCDMTDLFGDWVPDDWIDRCVATMILASHHTHQLLTKRADRMLTYWKRVADQLDAAAALEDLAAVPLVRTTMQLSKGLGHPYWPNAKLYFMAEEWPRKNVWLGVSVEDQQRADQRIPLLLRTPAAVRFLSCEPLLGRVDLSPWLFPPPGTDCRRVEQQPDPQLHWGIIGGESGNRARPCCIEWVRDLVSQFRAAGVACFTKQLGACVVTGQQDGEQFRHPRVSRLKEAMWIARGGYPYELVDPKGGDPAEWPDDLRVRQFPEAPCASR